jgi:O-antigen/teichoic acid export membrane protein
LGRAIEKTIYFISLAIFPLLVGMCVLFPPFTQLIPKYQKWQPAILIFVLYTLSIGWSAISTPLTNTLNAIGKINVTLKLMLMWTTLTWLLIPLGIKFFGYNGVGWATLAISFTSILPIYYVKKSVQINVWGNVWRQLLAASIMGLVGLMGQSMAGQSFVKFCLLGGLTAVTYGLVLVGVGGSQLKRELLSLRKRS